MGQSLLWQTSFWYCAFHNLLYLPLIKCESAPTADQPAVVAKLATTTNHSITIVALIDTSNLQIAKYLTPCIVDECIFLGSQVTCNSYHVMSLQNVSHTGPHLNYWLQ